MAYEASSLFSTRTSYTSVADKTYCCAREIESSLTAGKPLLLIYLIQVYPQYTVRVRNSPFRVKYKLVYIIAIQTCNDEPGCIPLHESNLIRYFSCEISFCLLTGRHGKTLNLLVNR